jgi:hypothetical protein
MQIYSGGSGVFGNENAGWRQLFRQCFGENVTYHSHILCLPNFLCSGIILFSSGSSGPGGATTRPILASVLHEEIPSSENMSL